MKRFVWPLQRVLDIKTKQEQIKRAELLAVTEKLAQARSELLLQKRILKTIIDNLTVERPKKRLNKQQFFLKCSTETDELIKRLEIKVGELESQQKEKIAGVLKLKRFKEGLEKLREETKTKFIKEQERLEQKQADEMTALRFARNMISRGKFKNTVG